MYVTSGSISKEFPVGAMPLNAVGMLVWVFHHTFIFNPSHCYRMMPVSDSPLLSVNVYLSFIFQVTLGKPSLKKNQKVKIF